MSEEVKLSAVRAKMYVSGLETMQYGPHESHKNLKVHMGVICGSAGEDKDFSDATPSGALWMNISPGRPAQKFFEPGKKYYVTFTEAQD